MNRTIDSRFRNNGDSQPLSLKVSSLKAKQLRAEPTSLCFKVTVTALTFIAVASLAGIICHAAGVLPSYIPSYSTFIAGGAFLLSTSFILGLIINRKYPSKETKAKEPSRTCLNVTKVALAIISLTALSGIVCSALGVLPASFPSYSNWLACGTFMLSTSVLIIVHFSNRDKPLSKAGSKAVLKERGITHITIPEFRRALAGKKTFAEKNEVARKMLGGKGVKPPFYDNWMASYLAPRGVEYTKEVVAPKHQNTFFNLLPPNVLIRIIDNLTPRDCLLFAGTNVYIHHHVANESLWWNRCRNAGFTPLDLNFQTPSYKALYLFQSGGMIDDEAQLIVTPKRHYAFQVKKTLTLPNGSLATLNDYTRQRPPQVAPGAPAPPPPPPPSTFSVPQSSTLYLWHSVTQKGTQLKALNNQRHKDAILDFDVKGNRIATVSRDKTLKIWDAQNYTFLASHSNTSIVTRVAFVNEDQLIFGDTESTLKVLKIEADHRLTVLQTIPAAVTGTVINLVALENGFIAVGHQDRQIKRWTWTQNERAAPTAVPAEPLDGHARPGIQLSFQARNKPKQVDDQEQVLLSAAGNELHIWDMSHEPPIKKLTLSPTAHISLTAVTIRGDCVVVGDNQGGTSFFRLKIDYTQVMPAFTVTPLNLSEEIRQIAWLSSRQGMAFGPAMQVSTLDMDFNRDDVAISTLHFNGPSLYVGSVDYPDLLSYQFKWNSKPEPKSSKQKGPVLEEVV